MIIFNAPVDREAPNDLIALTPTACAVMQDVFFVSEDNPDLVMRLVAMDKEAQPPTLGIVLDFGLRESDVLIQWDKLRIVVDAQSLPYIQGMTIDFAGEFMATRQDRGDAKR